MTDSRIIYKQEGLPPKIFNNNADYKKYAKAQNRTKIATPTIDFPKEPSEFDVQCYLVSKLRQLGIEAKGEVKGSDGCRFDIVIFKNEYPVKIIEIKRKFETKSRSQMQKYARYNIPIKMICGLREAKAYLEENNKCWFRNSK